MGQRAQDICSAQNQGPGALGQVSWKEARVGVVVPTAGEGVWTVESCTLGIFVLCVGDGCLQGVRGEW